MSSSRPRRQADDSDGHIVVYESGIADGECGIKPKNLERMRAPVRPAVLLKTDQADQVNEEETTGNEKASTSTKSTGPGAFVRRRRKRSNADQKAIELAVFVDDDLYQLEVDSGVDDPIQDIQDVVFTYLNSVMHLSLKVLIDYHLEMSTLSMPFLASGPTLVQLQDPGRQIPNRACPIGDLPLASPIGRQVRRRDRTILGLVLWLARGPESGFQSKQRCRFRRTRTLGPRPHANRTQPLRPRTSV